eukprot:TRINITY_DN64665_c0_g1_i1.p1 TRINITY_DN64665_c0_g1~~TRINITY_DN64665_c0_g1_i1.p1  ORF type:complete len:217 (+),score=50.58 TRINITY_DN64665_c0_g1_i1:56-706(+)
MQSLCRCFRASGLDPEQSVADGQVGGEKTTDAATDVGADACKAREDVLSLSDVLVEDASNISVRGMDGAEFFIGPVPGPVRALALKALLQPRLGCSLARIRVLREAEVLTDDSIVDAGEKLEVAIRDSTPEDAVDVDELKRLVKTPDWTVWYEILKMLKDTDGDWSKHAAAVAPLIRSQDDAIALRACTALAKMGIYAKAHRHYLVTLMKGNGLPR